MSHIRTIRRGRALAAVGTAAGLVLGAASVVSAPAAQSAAPAGDCAVPADISALESGEAVNGLTVTHGTTPEAFTGEVLGVLHDGIAPGVDMVMMRLSSPELTRVGGIWQGMSGSPVYTEDGHLIGAVAYGLSWGPSPVAGVTPFADMDKYLTPAAAPTVKVGSVAARAIAAATDVTTTQASGGFRQLAMPTGVSGLSSDRLAEATGRPYFPKSSYATGTAAAEDTGPGVETIVAGGNIAASLSYGDITMAGVGTATSVCNGRVVGFGHPLARFGKTSLAIHPADAIYIQEDPVSPPFKVANLGAPVGTITDDRTTGITGDLGPLPSTTGVTSTVNFNSLTRTGTSRVTVPQALAETTFYELIANHDSVIDGTTKGSELLSATITGDDNGSPFSLAFANRYASDGDITFDSSWELADLMWTLSGMPGVAVSDVAMTSDVSEDSSRWRLSGLEQWRAGAWQPVGSGSPVLARAGKKLTLRVKLTGVNASRFVPVSFMVPATAAGSRGILQTGGGDQSYYYGMDGEGGSPRTVAELRRMLAKTTRNDEVSVDMRLFGPLGSSHRATTAGPADKVVSGYKQFKVRVR